jgi:hypothetical protein
MKEGRNFFSVLSCIPYWLVLVFELSHSCVFVILY